ncbi:uncharacterized protein BKCO1_10003 [Diplodia corticola]|uniref:Transmembrane protein n=1 Tax=Diplodia corticola TaxID=236234 RepID=A0A1J9RI35_9PEZI|nr:uncharacterized protein BKCO1_10003 [Diplodia corticola]OJD40304.1 hypothetical protein BKCO1_10003 [Diplodia corticola]
MATVRDPMFWQRFSAAIRLDEEEKVGVEKGEDAKPADSKKSSRPKVGHSESWLERERVKKRRRNYICWGFWFGFLGFIAGVVVVIVCGTVMGVEYARQPAEDGGKGGGKKEKRGTGIQAVEQLLLEVMKLSILGFRSGQLRGGEQ